MKKIWNLGKYEDGIAFLADNGEILTYHELEHEGRELAGAAGERALVLCLCKNCIGSVLGYAGFLDNGVVPLLISSSLDRELLSHLIECYQPTYLWAPEDEEYPGCSVVQEKHGYVLLRTEYEQKISLYDELALLLTTSGSTGSPKFVRQSYDNILSNTRSIVEYLALGSEERPITTLPMNYTYGLSVINSHLYVGATILLTEKGLMQKEFWSFLKEQKATSFSGVPYTYEMLERLRFFRMELPSLKTMTQAGGKLPPERHERFARFAKETGKKFFVMYGQCEATARMGYLPAEKALEKKGSMGIVIPGGAFRLLDENGEEIKKPYVTGELAYEGANVTLGYAERGEDLSKGDERQGRLLTGDMAQFDEDGYYYIVGRKKRFLKIFGNRVNLDEMERIIQTEFGIEAACAGVDDAMCIYLTEADRAEEIRRFAAEKTGLNPMAFQTMIIPEIPKNEAGKVQYAELPGKY